MKLAAMFGSSSGAIGATAVGAVVLVAGAVGITVFNAEDDVAVPAPLAAVEVATPTPEITPEIAPVAEATSAVPEFEAPRLDLVRVAPDGNTVIAGQTSPDLAIAILLDGAEVALTNADGSGDFVALMYLDPSDSPRVLSLEARPEGAPVLAGVETVLVAPFAGPVLEVAEATEVVEPVEEVPVVEEVAAVAEEALVEEIVAVAEDPVVEELALVDPAVDLPVTDVPVIEDVAVEELVTQAPVDVPVLEVPDVTQVVELPEETEAPVVEEEVASVEVVAPEVVTPEVSAPETNPEPETIEVAVAELTPTAPPAAPGALAAAPGTLAAPSLSTSTPNVSAETRPSAPQPARALAPAVVIAGPEGLRVVQGPTDEPAVQTSVRLDAISYNAEGAVILAGRGPVSADIQVYLNNQPIQLGEIGEGGSWSLQLPDVDPGTYTLAVVELAEDGSTTSRVETPFLREDPVRVAEAPAIQASGIDVITVQPGFTLWGMAHDTFGDGILYVQIFEENRDQIRDPHWIFPGQIFRMPDVEQVNSGN